MNGSFSRPEEVILKPVMGCHLGGGREGVRERERDGERERRGIVVNERKREIKIKNTKF